MLRGVGDASLGEWVELPARRGTRDFVHVRRRLSKREALIVGDVRDIRGTEGAERRRDRIQRITGLDRDLLRD